MRIELRTEARQDLLDGAGFYDRQRQGLGDYFLDCLFDDVAKLEKYAGIHEKVFGVFRRLSDRFPFGIYYLVEEYVIDVVAVLDCRQDPAQIARRLS